MTVLKTSFWVFVIGLIYLLPCQVRAQSIPDIPLDIDFAGVTVHLNGQGRAQLQREVGQLYANRAGLQRDIESLRQLTPLLEPLLRAGQLPMDYRYAVLPFAGTEPTGYWNLSPARARALKLVVNDAVDERHHPILATEAVAAHLSQLHKVSDNYALTLLRYLRGDTLMNRLADTVSSTSLLLDAQTPVSVWKTIARKLAFEREEPVLRLAQTYLLYDIRHNAGYSLRTLSRQLQVDEERFKPFNTWLKAATIPVEKEYPVLIRVTADEFPIVKSRDDLRWSPGVVGQDDVGFPMLAKLPPSTVSTYESAVYYTINNRPGVQAQPCDNAITLAHYGKMPIKKFLLYNELAVRDVVQPGQIYYLKQKARRAKIPFHVVQKNQTLREIANVYGVRLASLLKFNRIQPTQRVQAGRIVWLRKKRPRNQPVAYRQLPVEEVKPEVDDVPTVAVAPPTVTDSLARQIDSLRHKIDSLSHLVAATVPAPTTAVQVEPGKTALPDKSLPEVVEKPAVEPTGKSSRTLKLHVVRRGETYYHISQVYGTSLKRLYAWNKLAERIPLEVGQKLIVGLIKKRSAMRSKPVMAVKPGTQPESNAVSNASRADPTEKVTYHTVRAGQTVYRVALINRVSIPDLMRWNNLKNYTIEIGQKLLIRTKK